MPRTRLWTCANLSKPCNEWPLPASKTSLWDISKWTVDAVIDCLMQSTLITFMTLGELLQHAWMGVEICASKVASWTSDVSALAWPEKLFLAWKKVSSPPKKPSLFVQFGIQSAWLHTVCSSAVCQVSTQSAPVWCVSPALLCQHLCCRVGHTCSRAPFGIALQIKRLWHP